MVLRMVIVAVARSLEVLVQEQNALCPAVTGVQRVKLSLLMH